MKCPKCPGSMHSYERNGVHIEQCESCRGIFLDHGELDALTSLANQYAQPNQYPPRQVPPNGYPAPPAWGGGHEYGHGYGHKRRGGFARMLFSS